MECKVCHNQSEAPVTSICCGLCKCCLQDAQKNSNNVCPVCHDKEFYKDKGCGEANKLADHLANNDGCQFEEVTCSNDRGVILQCHCLPSHVEKCPCRKVDCQHCHITGEYQFIEGNHKEQCPLPCPNKCSIQTPHENIEEHKKSCPLEEVTCTNNCGTILQRRYLTAHVNMGCLYRKVDCKYCHVLGQQQFIEGEHKEQCPKFLIACPNKCEVNKVPRDDIEQHMKICPLELVHCEYGCEERVTRKHLAEHNKENMDEHLSFTKQQLSLTNQELSSTKQQLATACDNLTKAQKECVTFMASTEAALAKLQTKITEIETASQKRIAELETQLHQNTQQFESILTNQDINWLATLYSQSSKLPSSDQVLPVIVTMSEYTKKKKYKTHWYSEPFYTHPKGYKLCFQIDPGCLGSDHLSVGLLLMKGPYDNLLMWPLVGEFEVKFLNQRKNTEHFLVAGDSQDNGRKRVLMKEKSSYFVWFNDTFQS